MLSPILLCPHLLIHLFSALLCSCSVTFFSSPEDQYAPTFPGIFWNSWLYKLNMFESQPSASLWFPKPTKKMTAIVVPHADICSDLWIGMFGLHFKSDLNLPWYFLCCKISYNWKLLHAVFSSTMLSDSQFSWWCYRTEKYFTACMCACDFRSCSKFFVLLDAFKISGMPSTVIPWHWSLVSRKPQRMWRLLTILGHILKGSYHLTSIKYLNLRQFSYRVVKYMQSNMTWFGICSS
jgi:hypothetical protein